MNEKERADREKEKREKKGKKAEKTDVRHNRAVNRQRKGGQRRVKKWKTEIEIILNLNDPKWTLTKA